MRWPSTSTHSTTPSFMYFPDQADANAADPVLALVIDPARRATLLAQDEGGALRFDVHLQGERETVFFAV